MEFENASYDATRGNWPDFRGDEPSWPCQWCHGATGIGLARIGTARQSGMKSPEIVRDVLFAVEGARSARPAAVDTLCCGTLGNVELFCEAANVLGRSDLRELALQRLTDVLADCGITRRLSLEQWNRAVQFGFVSWMQWRRLHGPAAGSTILSLMY